MFFLSNPPEDAQKVRSDSVFAAFSGYTGCNGNVIQITQSFGCLRILTLRYNVLLKDHVILIPLNF
jgi:hypothetical protein